MAQMPDYSVALCTYNGEKYISEQIDSILIQTVPPKEIVVSDDGSTDNTLSVVEEIVKTAEVPIRIVHNNVKHGVAGNFYNAIKECTAGIIFTSDQDDV